VVASALSFQITVDDAMKSVPPTVITVAALPA
jgi:hypothetical protein